MASKTVARKTSIRTELVRITPNTARKWLANNVHNRNVRPHVVRAYARDMKAGLWQVTGEAIKFNGDGTLLDGQHRLLAVVESDTPVQMFVIRGLPTSTQDVMDTGAKRLASDALQLNGYPYRTLLAAGIRLAINWENGEFRKSGQTKIAEVTNSEVLAFAEANPDIVERCSVVGAEWLKRIPAKPAVVLFTYWLTSRKNKEQSHRFFSDLAEYHTEGAGDPKAALLRRLNSIRRDNERISAPQQADLFLRAWNATREKRPLTKFNPQQNFTEPK